MSKFWWTVNVIKRSFLLFLFTYALFLLTTQFTILFEYVVETIALGVPLWLAFGFISPRLLIFSSNLPLGINKRMCLMGPSHTFNNAKILNKFLTSLDLTVTPTLFLFGVLNVILNYFFFMLGYGITLFVVLITFVTGAIFPPILILRDSGLIIIDTDRRTIQPLGRAVNNYLRGISGISALLGFFYTIFTLSFNIFATIEIIMAVITIVYPPMVAILFTYMFKHPQFVEKLNRNLSKKVPNCKVTVEFIRDSTGKIEIKDD